MRIFTLFATLILSINAYSEVGPELPNCPECDDISSLAMPNSTIWWNPDQSGVGVDIEIQGNQVFGVYFGYSDDGDSEWYTFAGELIESNIPGSSWELSTSLTLYENGKCINCDYQLPSQVEFDHEISITFNQTNHASYSIDDGETQNLIPLKFTDITTAAFPEQTDIKIPNLRGYWTFNFISEPVSEFNPIQTKTYMILSNNHVTNNDVSVKATTYLINSIRCYLV